MSIEAMKQALEALESCYSSKTSMHRSFSETKVNSSITSLRQAIAEAEKQEPVAGDGAVLYQQMISAIRKLLAASKEPSNWGSVGPDAEDVAWGQVTALLTHICVGIDSPPQRQPLTDEVTPAMKQAGLAACAYNTELDPTWEELEIIYKAMHKAAHGIKETK